MASEPSDQGAAALDRTPPRGMCGVLHFSFTVSDIEAAVDWYTRVLGLELVHRQRGENEYTRVLVGIDDAVIEAAQFRLPGISPGLSTHMLELVEYLHPRLDPIDLPTNRPGVAHIGFLVTDIHDRYASMVAAGVVFRNPPVAITEGANAGGWACYFEDPDGITLELLQPPPERITSWGD